MRIKSVVFTFITFFFIGASNVFGQFQQELPQNLVKEVEDHLKQADDLANSGDINQAAYHLNRVANIYWINGYPKKAVEYFEKTIAFNKQIGNLNAQRTLYSNIGMVYIDEEDYPKSLDNFQKSLAIARKMNRKPDIAATLINVANVQSEWGKHSDAATTLEEAHTLARELNDERMLRNCYSLLTDVYEKLGQKEKSAEYFSLFTAISQKIQREQIRKRDMQAQQMVEKAKSEVSEIEQMRQATEEELLDKQRALKETEESLVQVEQISKERQMQIDLLSKEKELQDAIIKNQRLVRNVFIFIIFVVVSFATLFLYNLNIKKKANQKLQKQNKEIAEQKDLIEQVNQDLGFAFNRIEKQNRDITSSINYAQRIQEALLPNPCNLSSVFPDSMVYFQPRDIVSGDFYWYTGYGSPKALRENPRDNFIKIPSLENSERGFLISAVDCTGHGVPGAFMSMIGFNLLETITRNGTIIPNQILRKLHNAIRYLLKQDTTDNRDGMDMALCSITDKGRKVLYSGAKNPLITVSEGELTYIKGDVYPIGGMQKEGEREFSLHTINVEKPTSFYIFSDGYTDQFGGINGKKFGTKSFKQLLLDINHLPMQEQASVLKKKMAGWMGNEHKQIDDIIIIGFKVVPGEVDL
jgi:serine phosphatase RsbU (regulator of sigma subunit)